jgi:16S rRNA (cytosine967-C5)-methyltransferase
MMGGFFHSYHKTASSILDSYHFQEPFALFLKNYFRRYRKSGSRDRKIISDLCYGFLRIGKSCATLDFNTQMGIGYYLTHKADNGYLDWLNFPLKLTSDSDIAEKIEAVKENFNEFDQQLLFPEIDSVIPEINHANFIASHLKQPPFFIRVRPGNKSKFQRLLKENKFPGEWVDENAICIESTVKLPDDILPDKDFVIQDISSQKTFDIINDLPIPVEIIWDVCAGSGGKTLMAADYFPAARIYASDIREEILDELHRRANIAGIKKIKLFCTDLEHPMSSAVVRSNLPATGVDLIIADVPCTGSGTWVRSPEWLHEMDAETIDLYQRRQIAIVEKLPQHLKKGGYLLYVTCSVYEQENTGVVDFLAQNSPLKLVGKNMLAGDLQGGDFLFSALFTLPI